jgi:tripartite ATP-independent transporter DctP family solute receptor
MNMKRFLTGVLAPAVVLAAVAGSAANAQQRAIKLGIGLAENHPQGMGAARFAEILDKKSGGKLKAKVYYSGSIGDDVRMVSALKGGVQEMTIPSTAPLVGDIKDFGVLDLPFMFNDENEADAVLDGAFGTKLLEKLPPKGLVGLCYWENGFRQLTNSKRPIGKAEDIQGLKVRVMQNPAYLETFNGLGANAVAMAFTEVYTALETRTVDAQENPIPTIETSKFNEVQKYLTLTKHTYSPFVVLVSKKFWDKLSPDEQKAMREACVEARDYQRKVNREANVKILESLKKAGMQVGEVPPQEVAKMREKVKPVIDKFAKEFGEASYKELQAEIAKVRKPS